MDNKLFWEVQYHFVPFSSKVEAEKVNLKDYIPPPWFQTATQPLGQMESRPCRSFYNELFYFCIYSSYSYYINKTALKALGMILLYDPFTLYL